MKKRKLSKTMTLLQVYERFLEMNSGRGIKGFGTKLLWSVYVEMEKRGLKSTCRNVLKYIDTFDIYMLGEGYRKNILTQLCNLELSTLPVNQTKLDSYRKTYLRKIRETIEPRMVQGKSLLRFSPCEFDRFDILYNDKTNLLAWMKLLDIEEIESTLYTFDSLYILLKDQMQHSEILPYDDPENYIEGEEVVVCKFTFWLIPENNGNYMDAFCAFTVKDGKTKGSIHLEVEGEYCEKLQERLVQKYDFLKSGSTELSWKSLVEHIQLLASQISTLPVLSGIPKPSFQGKFENTNQSEKNFQEIICKLDWEKSKFNVVPSLYQLCKESVKDAKVECLDHFEDGLLFNYFIELFHGEYEPNMYFTAHIDVSVTEHGSLIFIPYSVLTQENDSYLDKFHKDFPIFASNKREVLSEKEGWKLIIELNEYSFVKISKT